MKYMNIVRAFGAIAIGVSGALSIFGQADLAQVMMLFGTAAAAPQQ